MQKFFGCGLTAEEQREQQAQRRDAEREGRAKGFDWYEGGTFRDPGQEGPDGKRPEVAYQLDASLGRAYFTAWGRDKDAHLFRGDPVGNARWDQVEKALESMRRQWIAQGMVR